MVARVERSRRLNGRQPQRVLITGLTGFVGSHMADYLLKEHPDTRIAGLVRWRSPKEHIVHLRDRVELLHGDLTDPVSLRHVMDQFRPDLIFHLAAQSFVPFSYLAPAQTLEANAVGTLNLLEAVRASRTDPVIHVCSSSEVYGQVSEDEVPIKETNPLRPVSPYGVSKAAADLAAQMYHQAYGLRTIRSRAFTHSGPRRGEVFVDSFFSLQVAQIELGLQKPVVRVGNLESVRTFCDVRDLVRGYWLLVRHGVAGDVYNLGGSVTMKVGEMLDMLLSMTTHRGKIQVREDPDLLRPADVTLQIPSTEKFQNLTGWKPQIPYEQTLRDMLDYWRLHLQTPSGSSLEKVAA